MNGGCVGHLFVFILTYCVSLGFFFFTVKLNCVYLTLGILLSTAAFNTAVIRCGGLVERKHNCL